MLINDKKINQKKIKEYIADLEIIENPDVADSPKIPEDNNNIQIKSIEVPKMPKDDDELCKWILYLTELKIIKDTLNEKNKETSEMTKQICKKTNEIKNKIKDSNKRINKVIIDAVSLKTNEVKQSLSKLIKKHSL